MQYLFVECGSSSYLPAFEVSGNNGFNSGTMHLHDQRITYTMTFSFIESKQRTSTEPQCPHLIVAHSVIQNSIEYKVMSLNIRTTVQLSK